jgi:hypothetical protein
MTRGGIVMVAIGISLMMFFWSMTAQSIFHGPIESASWLPTIGFLPFMIGVALLVMAMVERRQPQ